MDILQALDALERLRRDHVSGELGIVLRREGWNQTTATARVTAIGAGEDRNGARILIWPNMALNSSMTPAMQVRVNQERLDQISRLEADNARLSAKCANLQRQNDLLQAVVAGSNPKRRA